MIGHRYQEKKKAVINVWKRYESFRGNTDDGVDQDFLKLRTKALEGGRYILAVVGETKAGKSSFINALLGERVLPTDVLQSSSAIIEIVKSERKYVKVLYADKHENTLEDEVGSLDSNKLLEYLRSIGSIQDRFRKIPTTLLDEYIVEGRIIEGQPIPFEELRATSKLPLKGSETLIEEYVRDRTLAQIPLKITLGLPLKYSFDELCLVDSPGINAIGGVQDRTFAYLHNANAVLFVHSLEGSIENSSFREFVVHVIPNRTKKSLFLVLSKSGTKNKIEIEEKLSEARSIFCEEFDPDRILHADSMFKIMSEEILRFDAVVALEAYYEERLNHFERLHETEKLQEWREETVNFTTKSNLLTSVLKRLGKDAGQDAVRTELRRLSNFEHLEQALDDFLLRAPELQLSEVLASIRQGYEYQLSIQDDLIGRLNKKRKHPQTFENELKKIKDLMSRYELSMNEFAERIHSDYSGSRPVYREDLDALSSVHVQQATESTDRNMVRKALADFHDDNRSFVDNVARGVRDKFKAELIRLEKEFKSNHSITMPAVDIDGIAAKAKDAAYCDTDVPRDPQGFWETVGLWGSLTIWRPTKTIKTYNDGLFDPSFKSEAVLAIKELISRDYKLISDLCENFITDFKKSLRALIDGQKKMYDELLEKKTTNAEILSEIGASEEKKKHISIEMSRANEMLGDLP